jgi:hypothetical protein
VAKSTADVSTALSWCYIALRQAERTRESFAAYEAARAAGREHSQFEFLYWGDAHFLISATYHMNNALERLSSGPELPKRLRNQIPSMRHLLEHWWQEKESAGSWKGLAEKHGKSASPWVAVGDDTDLRIGPDFFSLQELEQALADARDGLLQQYNPEDDPEEGLGLEEVLGLFGGLLQQHTEEPAPAHHKLIEVYTSMRIKR